MPISKQQNESIDETTSENPNEFLLDTGGQDADSGSPFKEGRIRLPKQFTESVENESQVTQGVIPFVFDHINKIIRLPPLKNDYAIWFGNAPRNLGEGTSGMIFGNMYADNITQTVTVSAADTAYEVTAGFTGGNTNEVTFGGDHYLEVTYPGKYLVNWSLSAYTGTALDEIEAGLMINGAAQAPATAHMSMAAANEDMTVSGTAILDLAAADEVGLYVLNHTTNRNIVMTHASLTLLQIGG